MAGTLGFPLLSAPVLFVYPSPTSKAWFSRPSYSISLHPVSLPFSPLFLHQYPVRFPCKNFHLRPICVSNWIHTEFSFWFLLCYYIISSINILLHIYPHLFLCHSTGLCHWPLHSIPAHKKIFPHVQITCVLKNILSNTSSPTIRTCNWAWLISRGITLKRNTLPGRRRLALISTPHCVFVFPLPQREQGLLWIFIYISEKFQKFAK